jgi:Cdc6-like AAA superfamily ATPase
MNEVDTATIYARYIALCKAIHINSLSKVRVFSFIAELDVLGLIRAKRYIEDITGILG